MYTVFKLNNLERGVNLKLLRQLCIILSICFLGDFTSKIFKLSIPGSIVGMIILFSCLSLGVIKLDKIEDISTFLLDHLAFFFLPAGVSLISSLTLLKGTWTFIVLISLLSTILVIIVTGFTIQLLKRR